MKAELVQKNIPDGWSQVKLGDIGEAIIGLTYSPKDVVSAGGMLVLRSSNVKDGKICYDDQVLVTTKVKEKLILKEGDILICSRNGSRSLIGKNAYIERENAGNTFGAFMTVYRTDIAKYAKYLFQSSYFMHQIRRDLGPTINQVTTGNLNAFKFCIPPVKQQGRIVAVLEAWDQAVQKLSKKIEAKRSIRKSLMQKLLTGKTRLPGFATPWHLVRLGDLFKERKELGRGDLSLLSITSDRGVINQSESDKKDTSNADKSKYKRICPGDIGYNTMRMWQGRSALSKYDGIISPAYTVVVPKKDVDSLFFSYLFKTPRLIHSFYQNSQGIVSDTLNCKYKDFKLVKCLVSDYDEQVAISKMLMSAEMEIEILERKLKLLKSQKKFLLDNLVTGKIRTPEDITARQP